MACLVVAGYRQALGGRRIWKARMKRWYLAAGGDEGGCGGDGAGVMVVVVLVRPFKVP
jgi:GTPase involved in cell partitioning and DNA repair